MRSGKADARIKWTKNTFRWALVLFTTVISSWGAADLDKFVAFIGCFAWRASLLHHVFVIDPELII